MKSMLNIEIHHGNTEIQVEIKAKILLDNQNGFHVCDHMGNGF